MQHLYVDQVQKLDVHSLMTKAVREVRGDSYALTVAMEKWPQIQGQPDSNILTIEIKLDRSTDVPATDSISGGMVLKFTMPDGRKCEQWVQIEGVPSRKRGRRWKVAWPCGERAQTLYFKHTIEQFDSRKSLGLKSRRKLPKSPLVRMRLYLRELEAKNPDPNIPKPLWMTEDRYQFLLGGITKEYIRFMSPLLGVPVMDFYDEYVEPDVNAMPEQLPLRDPQSLAMCYLDRVGKLQIKAKYDRKYGLPEGAAPDKPTHVWFGFFGDEAIEA
jgi:hypothetical protein